MTGKILTYVLSNDADYADKVPDPRGGIKLYPRIAPQNVSPPYGVYTLISKMVQHDKGGRGFTDLRVQVDHYGVTASESAELERLCEAALDHWKGDANGIPVSSIRTIGGSSSYESGQESMSNMSEFNIKVNTV